MAKPQPTPACRSGACQQGRQACPCPQACGLAAAPKASARRTNTPPYEPMFTASDVLRAIAASTAIAGIAYLAVLYIISAASA